MKFVSSIIVPCNCHLLFSFFMCLYRVKYLGCLKTRKYSLEHKCEWNLSLVCLFLAIVAFYLNYLDRVVLAHPFWTLATFPVCYSVLSCRTEHLPWVQNGPVGFEKKNTLYKKQYMGQMMIMFCQWDFNEQTEKLVRLLLYTSKNCSRKFHAWVHFVG